MPATIATGRHVLQLMSLEQRREALPPAGFPTRRDLRRVIEHALAQADNGNAPVFLVTPQERRLQATRRIDDTPDPDDQYVMLPPVRCVGHFRSDPLNPQSGAFRSELTFVWWQDEWASPIDPEIRKVIAAVDWHKHARDVTD